jgi:hypothetical protein
MRRKRWLWIALVAIAIGALLFHVRRIHRPISTDHAAHSAAMPNEASAQAKPAIRHLAHEPRFVMHVNPEHDARAWTARAEGVVRRKNARKFGAKVAEMLELPPAEAWPALVALAKSDDEEARSAATNALLLANECKVLPDQLTAIEKNHARLGDHRFATLPPDWAEYLRTIEAAQLQRLHDRAANCAGVGGTWDFAMMVLDRYVQPDDPDVQLGFAMDEDDDATAIADLRGLDSDNADVQRALGVRLMQSSDKQNQDEGRALLERLAGSDTQALDFLAQCLNNGCRFYRADPLEASAWVEQAAGLGDAYSLELQVGDLERAGRVTEAWAWALYQLSLARTGCFEFGSPSSASQLIAADQALRIQHLLDPEQQSEGIALAQQLIDRWADAALANLECGD